PAKAARSGAAEVFGRPDVDLPSPGQPLALVETFPDQICLRNGGHDGTSVTQFATPPWPGGSERSHWVRVSYDVIEEPALPPAPPKTQVIPKDHGHPRKETGGLPGVAHAQRGRCRGTRRPTGSTAARPLPVLVRLPR